MAKSEQHFGYKALHGVSGIVLTLFVGLHLFNHIVSLVGVEAHIEMMAMLRPIYRSVIVESLLLLAVLIQIVSGIRLVWNKKKAKLDLWPRIQIWSGLYLAFFFVIHVGAVLGGRYVLQIDTNFHFAAAGLNSFPFSLFFIPYYSLAILAFWAHLGAVHAQKMKHKIFGMDGQTQAYLFFGIALLFLVLILLGFTNWFQGYPVPLDYQILIGK